MHSELGIVSPCSSCNNQRSVSDTTPGGRSNVCPRRSITARYLYNQSDNSTSQASADYYQQLTLTGTGDDPSLTAALKNPVYDTNGSTVLVWIALLKDNPAVIDSSTGTTINPVITDPAFDTNYIQCQTVPFTPNSDEYGYFLKGALKEGETVVVHKNTSQYTPDGTQLLSMGGSVDRASNFGSIVRNPVIEDNCPEGT